MATLAIWGEVTPGAVLTKCGIWVHIVDVITCAIFGDCRLRGVDSTPYNTGKHLARSKFRTTFSEANRPILLKIAIKKLKN